MEQQQLFPGDEGANQRQEMSGGGGPLGAESRRLRAASARLFSRVDQVAARHLSRNSAQTLSSISQTGGQ